VMAGRDGRAKSRRVEVSGLGEVVDGVGVGFVPCFCGVSSGESDFGIGVCFNELFPEDRTRDVRHGLVDVSISSKKYMGALYSVISKQTSQS
jgi:hypothetical protein